MTDRPIDEPQFQRSACAIQHINVRRINGINAPYQIDELGPAINLIYGPNGIGKSRTAAAIQALIWPETASSRAEISGTLRLGDDSVQRSVEGGRVSHRGGAGIGSEASSVPASQRDRYLLTLHTLLRDGNRQFVESIQRETAGGYDLNVLRQQLKLLSRPKPRSRKTADGVHEANARVQALQAEHRALFAKEQSLSAARQCLADAREAAARIPLLQAALDYQHAADEAREAQALRASFEDPIGKMTGEELDRVAKMQRRLAEQVERRSRLEHELAGIAADLEATGFEAAIPPGNLVPELRKRLARMDAREADLRQVRQQIERESAKLHACRDRASPGITDGQLEALDRDSLRELEALSRSYWEVLAEELAEAALAEWVGGIETPSQLDQLRRGTDILARRIQIGDAGVASAPAGMIRLVLIGASVAIVALSAVLAVEVAPAWILFALFAVPVVIVAFRPARNTAASGLDDLRGQYDVLGLPHPASWHLPDVLVLLDHLLGERASAEIDQQKALRWASLGERRQRVLVKRQEIQARREQLIEEFAVAPDDASPDTLRLIADALDAWREASNAVNGSRAAEADILQEIESLLLDFSERLHPYGAGPVEDIAAAHGVVEDLALRIGRAQALMTQCETQRRTLDEQVRPEITSVERELAEIWAQYGLENGDIVGLTNLCERVAPCREAQRQLEAAEARLQAQRERLDSAPDLMRKTRDELLDALSSASSRADRREDIQKEISDVEASLGQARTRTQLEEAIADHEAAVESLRGTREGDYLDAAGWNIVSFIHDRNRTQNRPAVFREADSLLRRFTAGAFRLDLADDTDAEFQAVETSTSDRFALDQLSSGTRVQLLMAIRLAFIQVAETGPRLPLILDEALGNTDDLRANAIIDAAIEIARSGRQVIYFTAQQDEVAKWSARIADQPDGPSCRVHDLGAIRGKASALHPVRAEWAPPVVPEISVPAGTSYLAARDALGVGPVDFWSDHIDGVDLWYLIPDINALVKLRSRSIRTWGQYRHVVEDGRLTLPVDDRLHQQAVVRSRVVDEVRRSWQSGRPRPISPQELRDCGHISSAFIEHVVALCKDLDGDCNELINALRNRHISGFRMKVVQDLDDYFRQEGYTTDQEPLPDEMIRARAVSAAGYAIEEGLVDMHEIDTLLTSLTAAPEAVVTAADV